MTNLLLIPNLNLIAYIGKNLKRKSTKWSFKTMKDPRIILRLCNRQIVMLQWKMKMAQFCLRVFLQAPCFRRISTCWLIFVLKILAKMSYTQSSFYNQWKKSLTEIKVLLLVVAYEENASAHADTIRGAQSDR